MFPAVDRELKHRKRKGGLPALRAEGGQGSSLQLWSRSCCGGAGSTCLTRQACCCLWAWHGCQGQGSRPAPRPLCRCVFTCGEVPAHRSPPSLLPPVTCPPSQSGTGTSFLSHLDSKLKSWWRKRTKGKRKKGGGERKNPVPVPTDRLWVMVRRCGWVGPGT